MKCLIKVFIFIIIRLLSCFSLPKFPCEWCLMRFYISICIIFHFVLKFSNFLLLQKFNKLSPIPLVVSKSFSWTETNQTLVARLLFLKFLLWRQRLKKWWNTLIESTNIASCTLVSYLCYLCFKMFTSTISKQHNLKCRYPRKNRENRYNRAKWPLVFFVTATKWL